MRLLIFALFGLAFLFGCIGTGDQQNASLNDTTPPCIGCATDNVTDIPQQNQTQPVDDTNDTIIPQQNQTTNLTNITQPSACVGPSEYDIYTASGVSFGGEYYADVCVTSANVKKYYCRNNGVQSANPDCPPKYWCQNATCVKFPGSCVDTDNGNTPELKGHITVVYNPYNSEQKSDYCVDDMNVIEWYCNGTEGVSEQLYCGTGKKCADGRCIRSKCTETDGGDFPDIYGYAEVNNQKSDDACIDDTRLKEYYCYGDAVVTKYYRCANRCVDDHCTPKDEGT